jgi:hypothetical protein
MAAHQELVRASEEKMAEFGVPAEELGFQPQRIIQGSISREVPV